MRDNDNICFVDARTTAAIEVACSSGIGARESQQDAVYVHVGDSRALGVVCDGMGGMRGGQTASRAAADYVRACYEDALRRHTDFAVGGVQMVEAADDLVYSLRDSRGKPLGAGTTLAAAYLDHGKLFWFSVGDSRIYLNRGGEMVQVTTDHIYLLDLNARLQEGSISRTEYEREAARGEALISFVGMGGLQMLDVNDTGLALRPGDRILICSDGLYRTIPARELQTILQHGSVEDAAQTFLRLIRERMSMHQDNYSFVLFETRK